MKAIVLCAGHATRMRPLTYYVAKAMIPVAGRPLLEHILLKLRDHGFEGIVVALSLHADQVQHYFEDGARWGLSHGRSLMSSPRDGLLTGATAKTPIGCSAISSIR